MKLLIKKLKENAVVPKRATQGSAGYDLSACIDEPIVLSIGEKIKIPTGISIEIDNSSVALIYVRSSLAVNSGITLTNGVGVVDSDYRGEIIVSLVNNGTNSYAIQPKERIAQMVLTPIITPEPEVVDTLSETSRGEGGFGSTGRN